jgi:hypothetical protein
MIKENEKFLEYISFGKEGKPLMDLETMRGDETLNIPVDD